MHVLHLIDSLGGGGAERMLVDLANCTVAKGKKVSVCQTRSDGLLSAALGIGIEVLTLHRSSRFDFGAIIRFGRWVNENAVDLIHVHGRSSLLFLMVARLLRRIRCRTLLHDHYGVDLDSSVPILFRLSVLQIDMYVGASERLARWALDSGIDPKKVSYITNYIDLERLRNCAVRSIRDELTVSKHVTLGVVICGLRREKGIESLLHALSMVDHDKLKVVIVGGEAEKGYLVKSQDLAVELGVEDKVLFVGQRLDIVEYLKSFDFAVVPSLSESGPLVLIEYLESGLPVIATRTGQVSAVAESAGVGTFVDPGDVNGLAKALNDMGRLGRLERAAIGRRGTNVACEEFDLNRKIDQWLGLYKEVLTG